MEKSVGKNKFDKGMRAYFNEWKFKHPYPDDMQISLEHALKMGLNNIFSLLKYSGRFK
jgi:aminopeptidase N